LGCTPRDNVVTDKSGLGLWLRTGRGVSIGKTLACCTAVGAAAAPAVAATR
jgi:hypothetical protein